MLINLCDDHIAVALRAVILIIVLNYLPLTLSCAFLIIVFLYQTIVQLSKQLQQLSSLYICLCYLLLEVDLYIWFVFSDFLYWNGKECVYLACKDSHSFEETIVEIWFLVFIQTLFLFILKNLKVRLTQLLKRNPKKKDIEVIVFKGFENVK